LLAHAGALLDLGTGGGERIARLAPLPSVSIATDAYPPNVTVATRRLAPLGVEVIQSDPASHHSDRPQAGNRWPERRLPLADNSFDLVLASRSALSPLEVARILRRGGRLLTIQNGVEWRGETLADALGGTPLEWMLPGRGWNVGDTFRRSGLRIIDWREQGTTTTYRDIGTIVYTLRHVPWLIVDFHVERYRERLYRLHQRLHREGPFMTRGYTHLIEAHKP
jgi:SAM-dependent methyltransferase